MQLRGTYFHDHEYVFICLDDMIKLTHMLMTKVLQSLYFTLDSWQVRLNNTVRKNGLLIIIKNLAYLTHSDLHCCEQSKAHYSLGILLLLLLLHCIITQIIIIINNNNNNNNTDKKNLNNGQKGKPDILQIHQKGVYLQLSSFAYF